VELNQQAQDRELQRKIESARVKVELSARQAAQPSAQEPAQTPHAAAQSHVRQIERDELCGLVRAAYAANPAFSRADLARQTGWSEAMIRKVLKEVQGD
jgi:uncharacterized protein GlcG (DUF336 family)